MIPFYINFLDATNLLKIGALLLILLEFVLLMQLREVACSEPNVESFLSYVALVQLSEHFLPFAFEDYVVEGGHSLVSDPTMVSNQVRIERKRQSV